MALRHHTVALEPGRAAELASVAPRACTESGNPVPPREFYSDGCSVFMDGNWADCCIEHDVAYWCGGSYWKRLHADVKLGGCVMDKGYPVVGQFAGLLMPPVIQITGMSIWPTWYRWGYGHPSSLECHFQPEAGCK